MNFELPTRVLKCKFTMEIREFCPIKVRVRVVCCRLEIEKYFIRNLTRMQTNNLKMWLK